MRMVRKMYLVLSSKPLTRSLLMLGFPLTHLFVLAILLVACSKEAADDIEPVVAIIFPITDSEVSVNEATQIKVIAYDNSLIERIELYLEDELLQEFNLSPCVYDWVPMGPSRETYLYAKAIDGNGNEQNSRTVEISIVEHQENSLSGKIRNVLGDTIWGAEIAIGDRSFVSENDGSYHFDDIALGEYMVTISADFYDTLHTVIKVGSGNNILDFNLVAGALPQISKLRYSDLEYEIRLMWDDLSVRTLQGYNIYYRKTNVWTQTENGYIYDPNWSKLNNTPIKENQFIHDSEEFNAFYDYYVLPVNIAGLESDSSSETKILEVSGKLNNELLYELPLFGDQMLGSFTIPQDENNFILIIEWDIQAVSNTAEWDLHISNNQALTFHLLHKFSNRDNHTGKVLWFCSLEDFKGQEIYLKRIGEPAGSLTISRIQNFIF